MAGHLTDKQDSHKSPLLGANEVFTSGSIRKPPVKHCPRICLPPQNLPLSAQGRHDPLPAFAAARYPSKMGRSSSVGGKDALRYVLSIYLNCSPHPSIVTSPLGALWQTGELKADRTVVYSFNLFPYPGSGIAIALHSHNPVGIDIERVKAHYPFRKAMAKRCLTPWGGHHCPLPRPAHRPATVFSNTGPPKKPSSRRWDWASSYPMKHVEVFLETVNLTNQPATIPMALPSHPHPSALLNSAPVLDGYRLYQWQPEANGIAAVAIQDATPGTPSPCSTCTTRLPWNCSKGIPENGSRSKSKSNLSINLVFHADDFTGLGQTF